MVNSLTHTTHIYLFLQVSQSLSISFIFFLLYYKALNDERNLRNRAKLLLKASAPNPKTTPSRAVTRQLDKIYPFNSVCLNVNYRFIYVRNILIYPELIPELLRRRDKTAPVAPTDRCLTRGRIYLEINCYVRSMEPRVSRRLAALPVSR